MKRIPVAVIDKDEETVKKITTLLKNISDLEIIQSSTSLEDLEVMLKEKISGLVMLGPTYKLEEVEKLLRSNCSSLYSTKVILLVKETSADLLRKAIKLNIHDVLEFPFNSTDIKESIKRVEDIFVEETIKKPEEMVEKDKKSKAARRILVFSTKGGSGKSFISCNLAVDLVSQVKGGVVLFDLNYQFGDVALMLNLYPKHTIYDILSQIEQMDSEMLNSFLTIHSSGVKVLPAPIDPTQGEAIKTEATLKIMDILSKISEFIIIDTPSAFSDDILSLLEKIDFICIVASMDVPSIKNLKISLQVLDQLKFPREKIIIILNRAASKVGITLDEVEKTIRRKIDVTIPSDRIVPVTVNKGVPVVTEAPKSAVSKSIRRLTNLIAAPKEKVRR